MKEYLAPGLKGYVLVKNPSIAMDYFIEIPEGADEALSFGNVIEFYRNNRSEYYSTQLLCWKEAMRDLSMKVAVWNRATHPEELPFIDNEPKQYHDNYHIRPKPRQRVYAVMGEWSPDWSQAPEWADAWRTTECGQAWWSCGDWFVRGAGWHATGSYPKCEKAPSFGFTGDWKQSECRRYLQHVILEQTVSA